MRWFRNIKAGEPFDIGSQSLDFSLQLSVGIQNFCDWSRTVATLGGAPDSGIGIQDVCQSPRARGTGSERAAFTVHGLDRDITLPVYPISRSPEDP